MDVSINYSNTEFPDFGVVVTNNNKMEQVADVVPPGVESSVVVQQNTSVFNDKTPLSLDELRAYMQQYDYVTDDYQNINSDHDKSHVVVELLSGAWLLTRDEFLSEEVQGALTKEREHAKS